MSDSGVIIHGCVHVGNFKAAKGMDPFKIIHTIFIASSSADSRKTKAEMYHCAVCNRTGPRLHSCLHCAFFGCYNLHHIQDHSKAKKHFLAVDLICGVVYCFQCGDYVYDPEFEVIAERNKAIAASSLGLPQYYKPWEPSLIDIELLKLNPKRRRVTNDSTIGLRGLVNLGNTCFMNCILQALTHTPLLREFFLSDQHVCQSHISGICLVCEIVQLFQEFFSGEKTPLVLNRLLHLIWTHARHLAGYEQQDAHEFFIATLDVLHRHCQESNNLSNRNNKRSKRVKNNAELAERNVNSAPNSPSHISVNSDSTSRLGGVGNIINGVESDSIDASKVKKENKIEQCHCIIDKIFTGGLQSDVICQSCKGISTTVDPFWDISLDLGPSMLNKSINQPDNIVNNGNVVHNNSAPYLNQSGELKSLLDCLERFTKPEPLGSSAKIKCNNCQSYQESTKQLTMKKLPIVASFHLKRFEHSSRNHKKISTLIGFPEKLNMHPYMSHQRSSTRNNGYNTTNINGKVIRNYNNAAVVEDDGRCMYTLFAVINHIGTIEAGHYIAYVRQHEDKWFKCDDHLITKAQLKDVLDSEGYLLFYHKAILEYE